MATQLRAQLSFDAAHWFAAWSEHGGIAFVVNERLFLSQPSRASSHHEEISILHDELFMARDNGEALIALLVARSFGEMQSQSQSLAPAPDRGLNPVPPLTYPDVVAALRRHPISQTRFGREACDDPRLVSDMRKGREVGFGLQRKIRAYIDRLDREAGL